MKTVRKTVQRPVKKKCLDDKRLQSWIFQTKTDVQEDLKTQKIEQEKFNKMRSTERTKEKKKVKKNWI